MDRLKLCFSEMVWNKEYFKWKSFKIYFEKLKVDRGWSFRALEGPTGQQIHLNPQVFGI
jgi:hypothetical protein